MRLFTLSIAAVRDDPESDEHDEVAMQNAVVLYADDHPIDEQRMRAVAEDMFPPGEGWRDQVVSPQEITNPYYGDGYKLTWRVELIDPPATAA